MKAFRTAVATVSLILIAACGTTVPRAEQLESSGAAGASGALAGGGPEAGNPATESTSGVTVTSGASARQTAGSADSGSPQTSGAAANGARPRVTEGAAARTPGQVQPTTTDAKRHGGALESTVTRSPNPQASRASANGAPRSNTTTPFKVGVVYETGTAAAESALGIKGVTVGDTQAQAQALIDSINKSGGIAGRQLTPVFAAYDTSQSAATEEQAICTAFTQDNHVDVALSDLNAQQSLATCLKAAGVPFIDDEAAFGSTTATALGNYWFGPADITIDRLGKQEVDALAASRWMTGSDKIGIFAYDDADATNAITKTVQPELKALGLDLASTQQVSDDATGISGASSAELAFRSAGVDRILTLDASPLFLMEAAQSQAYYPEYGLNSGLGPGTALEGNAPAAQLKGAAGLGWVPYNDIGAGTKPANFSPNEGRCFAIMTAAQQGGASDAAAGFELQQCDMFFFIQDAGNKGGGLTPAELATGAAALGNWSPASSFGSAFPGGRSDGVAEYRIVTYTDSCSCFQYTSAGQPMN